MKRPPFEVADIIRAHGDSFVEKSRSWLTWLHLRVLSAFEQSFPCFSAAAVSPGLDSLRQKTLRRARTRPALPGPLHASRRYLQPPHRRLCRRQGHVPLERLHPQEQETADDGHRRRVSAAGPPPHHSSPPLWHSFFPP